MKWVLYKIQGRCIFWDFDSFWCDVQDEIINDVETFGFYVCLH